LSSIIPGITPPPFPPSVVLLSVIVVGHLPSASGCEPSGHVFGGGGGGGGVGSVFCWHNGSVGLSLQNPSFGRHTSGVKIAK
jgi:hypothetical protein